MFKYREVFNQRRAHTLIERFTRSPTLCIVMDIAGYMRYGSLTMNNVTSIVGGSFNTPRVYCCRKFDVNMTMVGLYIACSTYKGVLVL